MTNESGEAGVILAFVRGERPWSDLERLGAQIAFSDDGCDIEGTLEVVRPSVQDIAQGLVRHLGEPRHHLQKWAQVVMAGSAFIDLAELEAHPDGERILNALWDAMAGDPLEEHVVLIARSIAKG